MTINRGIKIDDVIVWCTIIVGSNVEWKIEGN